MSTYESVKQDILRGRLQPVYLFCGSEFFLREDLLRSLYDSFLGTEGARTGVSRVEKDDLSLPEVMEELSLPVFFSGGRRIAVIYNPSSLVSRKGGDARPPTGQKKEKPPREDRETESLEAFWERERFTDVPRGIIVFCVDEVDKRRRMYRLLDKLNAMVDCSPLKGAALNKWINRRVAEKGKSIGRAALESFLFAAGGDLFRIENELSKIDAYMMEGDKEITGELVDILVYHTPQNNIFKLVDALGSGMEKQAYSRLMSLFTLREPPPMILHMIARHFRLLLQARCLKEEGFSSREATPVLKVQPFVAGNLFSQCRHFSRQALSRAIQLIQETDLEMKTGKTEAQAALEMLICRLAGLRTGGQRSE